MDGLLVINKPANWTSFDVVAKVRKLTKEKKVGHTGTLDPMATGVLLLMLGRATKLNDYLSDGTKEYVATMKLGEATDTLDSEGTIIDKVEINPQDLPRSVIEETLGTFIGDSLQVPPMYSALKKDGQRLYDLARQGVKLELDGRPVTIYAAKVLAYDFPNVTFHVTTSRGTYIRSLIRDLGEKLGTKAHMTALIRSATGGYTLEEALDLETLDKESILDRMIPTDVFLSHLPTYEISQTFIPLLENGVKIKDPRALADHEVGTYRLLDQKGRLLGLVERTVSELRMTWQASR